MQKKKGLNIFKKIGMKVLYYYFKIFKPKFEFNGEKYKYLVHQHGKTWNNERIVEVPIVWREVEKCKGNVLELGNVLGNYFSIQHEVVDKYEKTKGVVNEDIVSFNSGKKYDLIASISTLEHVGFDEEEKEPFKALKALKNMKSLLAENGEIVLTFPLGYNKSLDSLLKEKKLGFDEQYFMKRVSRISWKEAEYNEVKDLKYSSPLPCGNAVFIGRYKK